MGLSSLAASWILARLSPPGSIAGSSPGSGLTEPGAMIRRLYNSRPVLAFHLQLPTRFNSLRRYEL